MSAFRLAPLALGAILAAGSAAAQRSKVPDPFVKPAGPYPLGTVDTLWIDQARDEVLTKDPSDKRRVPVQIWYPAEPSTAPAAPWVRRRAEFGAFTGFDSLLHVRTNSVDGARLAGKGGRFPVLVYHHGGSWTRFSGTFTTEWLASHGYVVVGVDHNGFNKSSVFSDGYKLVQDTLQFPPGGDADKRAGVLAQWDYLGNQLFPMWVGDARFVLDQLERLDKAEGGRFKDRLDLSKIGMLGWSFGGATSVEMLVTDPRVKAAVDQDGQLFGRSRTVGATRPVMLLHNDADPVAEAPEADRAMFRELVTMVDGWTRAFTENSTGPVYDVTIAKSTHGHFSDLTLFFRRDSTKIDPKRAHEVINAYTLQFFDRYLKGQPAPLLENPSAGPPEATVHRKEGSR